MTKQEMAVMALMGAHSRPKKALRLWKEACDELSEAGFAADHTPLVKRQMLTSLAQWSGQFQLAAQAGD